jgi:AcrR family transcriptional regulator
MLMTDSPSTEELILDAAEELFAEKGFEGVSIRDIVNKAGVNVASINYHFGCKKDLIRTVLKRRTDIMNKSRLQMLEMVSDKKDLEQIFRAFISPAFELSRDTSNRGPLFLKLAGRIMGDANKEISETLQDVFQNVLDKFREALIFACPQISPAQISIRFFFIIGAMAHTLLHSDFIKKISEKNFDSNMIEKNLIEFSVKSFRK